MNYYTLRRVVNERVKDWLISKAKDDTTADPYPVFVRRLILETGCSEKMIKEAIGRYGLAVEGTMLVKEE